ncbi:MAG: SdpI family protein [Candidatus Aenigmarchaeota archaeon]|nr:SdpI family protein [Candidatus Aenigmarchaeota archaeon]
MRKVRIAILIVFLSTLAASLYFYAQLPEMMPSHWNAEGDVDSYMPKAWGAFLVPFLIAAIACLLLFIPETDPMKQNVDRFRNYYDGFVILLAVFMAGVHFQLILWALGVEISPNNTFPIGIGIMFFYIGILLEKSRRNWFIGIRTPWTMSSDRVWEKTHKLGGILFKIAGLVSLTGVFFPAYSVLLILISAILAAVFCVIYSYFEYQKEKSMRR